ncbi:MAG TPA: PAS domain S-box protein [Blastocatellia bacterium]|nr:PAS domain S-box protein [Blastocatellia bacterium]
MTKPELVEALRSLQGSTAQSLHTLQQQARLLELSYDAIFVWELSGGILYWNSAAAQLYGWTQEEALGRISNDLLKTIHPEGWMQIEQTLLREGHWYGELIHQTRDGRRLMVDSRHVLVNEADGRRLVLETNRDLTARKQAEEALSESQVLTRAVLGSLKANIAVLDRDGRIVDTNEAWNKFACENCLVGFHSGLEENYLDVCRRAAGPDAVEAQAALDGIQAVLNGSQSSFSLEYPCHSPDEERWFLMTVTPLKGLQGVVVSHINVTAQKNAELALRESEARLTGIVASAMDAIITIGTDQCILLFNPAAERMFGYSTSEVLGRTISLLMPERFRAAHERHIGKFGKTGETTRSMGALGTICGLAKNGREFPIEASISQSDGNGPKLYTVILRDITERLRAQERLVEQATLLDQSMEAIVVRDMNGLIRYWSRGAERLYGWAAEEVIGRAAAKLLYGADSTQLTNAVGLTIKQGKWNGELRQFAKDGREVIVEGHWTLVRDAEGNPKNILAINTDITEKKKLESQFLRAQRLESIGTLASGIAHDLNNILSPISMGAQMLQTKLQDEQSLRLIGMIEANARRGAEMVKQVLSFARGLGGRRVVLQPKHLIREIVRIAEETFPKSIRIEQRLAGDLWTVSGDATQLHQVLLNLCVNARDAMPQGGTLTIAAENRRLDDLFARMLKGANPGDFVVITVADTGVGIPPESLDRIFDPFFTTKESGHGTGLGLATVQGIVAGHGGFITVESKPGTGAKFYVYLPAHDIVGRQVESGSSPEMPEGRGEMILVIDDEAAVREMTAAALETYGYRTLTADNGATALALFVNHKDEINLVITDLMMPIVDGVAAVRALRKMKPDICVIATSGLAASADIAELKELGVETLLEKPYNAEKLLKAVAESVRRPPGSVIFHRRD